MTSSSRPEAVQDLRFEISGRRIIQKKIFTAETLRSLSLKIFSPIGRRRLEKNNLPGKAHNLPLIFYPFTCVFRF